MEKDEQKLNRYNDKSKEMDIHIPFTEKSLRSKIKKMKLDVEKIRIHAKRLVNKCKREAKQKKVLDKNEILNDFVVFMYVDFNEVLQELINGINELERVSNSLKQEKGEEKDRGVNK